ncbi:MAG TPA: hypothetical protein PK743_05080 [Luteimonas sp.]|nr:hypothetical protein [Luteimonas sp.]HRO25811.1 hypothetical protein [Luteimonas sp.]HRP71994.1 hypothetical protein [Luteimonas sp.]
MNAVIPAKAGIHLDVDLSRKNQQRKIKMDPGFRRDDGCLPG